MLRLAKLVKPPSWALIRINKAPFGKFDCDSCSKHLTEPQCKACDRMVNYFQIFSIPQKYKIDPEAVKIMARDLQKQFHPDKCGERTGLKEKMEKYSSYINEAKATLLNDLQRAIYLMNLRGVQVKEEVQVANIAFVQEMFALQQEIEEVNSAQEGQIIKKRVQAVLVQVQKELELFFTSDDLQKCREFVIKYKYLSSALSNVKLKIANLKQVQIKA